MDSLRYWRFQPHSRRCWRLVCPKTNPVKTILLVALMMFTANAQAEWTLLLTDSAGISTYADMKSVRKTDKGEKIWLMMDYTGTKNTSSVKSMVSQNEFDCAEEAMRTIAFSRHDKPLGQGMTINYNNKTSEWGPLPPNSTGRTILDLICPKH